jgi:hypothetical protein
MNFATLALLGLLWDYDGAAPTDFLVILESTQNVTGVQNLLVAGVSPGVCTQLPTGNEAAFCTVLSCPGPGKFKVTVESLAYKTRSETRTFQVKDRECRQVEGDGIVQGLGNATGLPVATHCRPPQTVTVAPVETQVPSQQPITVQIPVPHTTAPAIPVNPKVIPKQPHDPGTVALPTQVHVAKIPTSSPPAQTAMVASGPTTTVRTEQPTPTSPGTRCP